MQKYNQFYKLTLTIAALLILSAGAAFCAAGTIPTAPDTTVQKTSVQTSEQPIKPAASQNTSQTTLPTTDKAAAETLGSSVIPVKKILIKFGISMLLVIVSLVVLVFSLNFLKRFFKQPSRITPKELYNDTLKTPKTIDEAIISFIKKNKL